MHRDSSVDSLRHYIKSFGLDACFPEPFPYGLELHIYQKGEYFCQKGGYVESLNLIVKGKCQVIPASEDGRAFTLTLLKPLDMIGDIELLMNCSVLHDVYVLEDTITLSVPQYLFHQKMMNHVPFLQLLCRRFAQKNYMDSIQHSTSMLYPLRCRVSLQLYSLVQTFGSPTFPVNMKRMSQELMTSDRHLRRIFSELEQEGILLKNGRMVTIQNMERLNELTHPSDTSG